MRVSNKIKQMLRYIDIIGSNNIMHLENASLERGAKIDALCGVVKISKNTKIGRYASIYSQGGSVIIGQGVSIRQSSILFGFAGISIGSGSRIGPNTVITSHNHSFNGRDSVSKLLPKGECVVIGDNVWIGANVVILPGTKLGDGCVVGAGSVVSGSYTQSVIYAKRELIVAPF